MACDVGARCRSTRRSWLSCPMGSTTGGTRRAAPRHAPGAERAGPSRPQSLHAAERRTLSHHSPVAKALNYMLRHWGLFARFLDNGRRLGLAISPKHRSPGSTNVAMELGRQPAARSGCLHRDPRQVLHRWPCPAAKLRTKPPPVFAGCTRHF